MAALVEGKQMVWMRHVIPNVQFAWLPSMFAISTKQESKLP